MLFGGTNLLGIPTDQVLTLVAGPDHHFLFYWWIRYIDGGTDNVEE
jgi:hypothetical protein